MEVKSDIYKDISDAARGVTSEVAGVSRQVEGVGKEVLNNRFATERGLCDLGYKTNSDTRDSRDQMGAGFNRVMDRLCQMEHQQSDCCREIKSLVRESENRLALQAERNHCEVMKGQQEIKCLIENTAKDQEIARLNRVVDEAQRLIDIYGYYNFLNLVEFMKQNPSMVQMGLSLINKNNAVGKK